MAKHIATAPDALINKIRTVVTDADKAAAQALNKTATFAIERAVSAITDENNLQPGYVKKHLKVVNRASPVNLRTVITANERGTLLTRYPFQKTRTGVDVNVKKSGGARTLKGAFIVSGLKGSGASGVALNLKSAVEFFKLGMMKGQRTARKSQKLQRIIADARTKKRGIVVLHGSSVNQMFEASLDDLKTQSESFLVSDFIDQLKRIRAK